MLTKDAIKLAKDIRTTTVSIPEWGGEVTVREFDGLTRDKYDRWMAARTTREGTVKDLTGWRAYLAALSIVDDNGKPIFDADNKADIAILEGKAAEPLSRVVVAAMRLNGLGAQEAAEQRSNFTATQKTETGTDSPKAAESQTSAN